MAAPDGPPDVTLADVSLSYGDTKVLNALNLTAQAGQTTALVGASGAGKSTIFNLLTRLVDPQSGTVQIGGVDTTSMTIPDLRGLFSVVTQEALLFDEPTSALDPELEQEVVKVIKDLAAEGRTMVIVTHDMKLAADVSDHVVFLHQGLIEEQGTPEEVFGAPKSERLRGFLSATQPA